MKKEALVFAQGNSLPGVGDFAQIDGEPYRIAASNDYVHTADALGRAPGPSGIYCTVESIDWSEIQEDRRDYMHSGEFNDGSARQAQIDATIAQTSSLTQELERDES